jgi:hypothetical protein
MTFRRWCAVICLLSVAGSAALRVLCETECASMPRQQMAESCHEEPADSAAALRGPNQCGEHSILPALVSPRRSVIGEQLSRISIALPASTLTYARPRARTAPFAVAVADTSPPASSRPLALRI